MFEQTKSVRFDEQKNSFSHEENQPFKATHEACTPKIDRTQEYRAPESRNKVVAAVAPNSSVAKPNYDDALRRVAVVVESHIKVCERKRARAMMSSAPTTDTLLEAGEFQESMLQTFSESNFLLPQYKLRFVRLPMARPGAIYAMQHVEQSYSRPTVAEIYSFIATLFNKARLSSECSIVCLIYVERLMEIGKVPLTAQTWRPVLLCGLLLASKVWQDYASWSIEFSYVYPQFPLVAINRLERLFLKHIKWDMYINQSLYAKYYFALRALTEKQSFRRRYNSTVIQAPHMEKVAQRTNVLKKDIARLYSSSY